MKKVLIADDEMYALQMMASIVDWQEYGLELAGRASSCTAVLDFLEKHSVDLLITDLTMPGMDEAVYLQALRRASPRLAIIVLTVHQEFEVIQAALRTGVDDYIAKAQVDKKTFGPLLRSVMERQKKGRNAVAAEDSLDIGFLPGGGDAFRFIGETGTLRRGEILLKATHTQGLAYLEILSAARVFYERELFYTAKFQEMPAETRFDARQPVPAKPESELQSQLSEMLKSPGWILSNTALEKALSLTARLRTGKERLPVFFYRPVQISAEYSNLSPGAYFDAVQGFLWWHEWESWLRELHGIIMQRMGKDSDALRNIRAAQSYLQEHFTEQITLGGILRQIALSRSHFSALFKAQTGVTFVEYVQNLRIGQAKRYLTETGWSVSEIAYKVGYQNESNFRRTFFGLTGESPAAYRKNHAPDSEAL